jgi:hypothetical protein
VVQGDVGGVGEDLGRLFELHLGGAARHGIQGDAQGHRVVPKRQAPVLAGQAG